MQKRFIFQRFDENCNYIVRIQEILTNRKVKEILVAVAFVRKGGIAQLIAALENITAKTTVFAGINNDVTSFQGLESLFDNDVTVCCIDTNSKSMIFHPKIYLFKSDDYYDVIIGSGNLTNGGFIENIEVGAHIILKKGVSDDDQGILELDEFFKTLLDEKSGAITEICSEVQLEGILSKGKLTDELIKRSNENSSSDNTKESLPALPKLSFLKKAIHATSALKKLLPQAPRTKAIVSTEFDKSTWEHIWESNPLTERDLNIPTGVNTNLTGSMNLSKGSFDIEFQTYFRSNAFLDAVWTIDKNPNYETTTVLAQLIILGENIGEKEFTIRHDPRTNTKTYKQKNCMSHIRWGALRANIAERRYLEKRLSIYRNKISDKEYSYAFVIQ